jgi:hypothetical protein
VKGLFVMRLFVKTLTVCWAVCWCCLLDCLLDCVLCGNEFVWPKFPSSDSM